MTKAALSDIDKYWQEIEQPGWSDWQHCYPKDGWGVYPKFGGKKYRKGQFDTLCIQPIVWAKNSAITDRVLNELKTWLEAFYQPCKVEILPKIMESALKKIDYSKLGT